VLAAAMPVAVILLAGEDTTGSVRPLTHWCERQGEDVSAALTSSIDSDIVEIGGHLAPVLRSRHFGPCGATLQVIVLGSIPERAFNARDAALLDDIVDMVAPKLASASVAQTPEITELKRREESARLLFESHPLPMLVIDVETLVILDVNAASVAFYGYSRDEMLALRLPDIRPEKTSGEIGWYLDNADDAEVADRPRIHRLKSGEERVVRVSMQIVERDGRKVILAAFYDITERQKMEAEVLRTRAFLRHVVDTIPVAVFVKDMRDDGRYVLYNKTGQDVLGFDGASVIGNFDTDLFDPEVVAEFRRQDEETLKRGAYDFVEETFATGRDHQVRFIRTRKVALKDGADGKARYVLGISEDITEQRVREREIAHLAHHDSLTGLPNRFQFESRMAPTVSRPSTTHSDIRPATFCCAASPGGSRRRSGAVILSRALAAMNSPYWRRSTSRARPPGLLRVWSTPFRWTITSMANTFGSALRSASRSLPIPGKPSAVLCNALTAPSMKPSVPARIASSSAAPSLQQSGIRPTPSNFFPASWADRIFDLFSAGASNPACRIPYCRCSCLCRLLCSSSNGRD
jgi:PAS domain S-box-containing protein